MMKINKWTLGLAAVGLITIPATMQAEEKMSAVQTMLSSTTISGYVDTAVQWGWGRTVPPYSDLGYDKSWGSFGTPPAYAFNGLSKQDGFNLNCVNLVIEKPLDAQDNWAAGYKIDMIYGPNAVGWNTSVNTDYMWDNDFALKQAYVALRAPVGNGIDFKIGTFDSIIGYETFHAGNNPNYTRTYAYTMEPTQHTGLLASYQFCKEFGIAGGIANTWNAGINNRPVFYMDDIYEPTGKQAYQKTWMGAVTFTAPDSWGALAGSTAYGGIVSGFDNSWYGQRMSIYGGMTLNTGVKGLKVGACYDYSSIGNTPEYDTDYDSFWFNAFGGYVSYQATEKLSLHLRGEYYWSDMWSWGMPSSGFDVTATVQYDLWANVLSRLEFRWDRAADGSYPFNYYGDENSWLLALNVIYKF